MKNYPITKRRYRSGVNVAGGILGLGLGLIGCLFEASSVSNKTYGTPRYDTKIKVKKKNPQLRQSKKNRCCLRYKLL